MPGKRAKMTGGAGRFPPADRISYPLQTDRTKGGCGSEFRKQSVQCPERERALPGGDGGKAGGQQADDFQVGAERAIGAEGHAGGCLEEKKDGRPARGLTGEACFHAAHRYD